jgi:hypothetical protein
LAESYDGSDAYNNDFDYAWKQIALAFADRGPRLMFEVMNEVLLCCLRSYPRCLRNLTSSFYAAPPALMNECSRTINSANGAPHTFT